MRPRWPSPDDAKAKKLTASKLLTRIALAVVIGILMILLANVLMKTGWFAPAPQ